MKRAIANTQVNRAFRVLLILLIVALSVSGCRQKAMFEKGFDYTFNPKEIMLGAISDTDLFDKHNVNFDLCYGTHDIGYCEKYGINPRALYAKTHLQGADLFFGLYICDAEYEYDIANDMEFSEYKAIDNHYFVKEISEKEAFSEEYGLTMSRWKGITYNHSEKVTIPAETFKAERGRFVIKLVAFHKPISEGDSYYTSSVGILELNYQIVDENTVRITF
ncbi:MAG: hypothetical protein E7453_08360 [Ruminococcaceae bacterium]|nr:hypothetical protein [Oscillospiraceae bacterium]